ncbi:MAG TPA: hypothetical protein DDZ67_05200, partial [Xanthomonadaceae bacterium]|nr:hypothetical protein [Xanthomonadaceae bacterium]
MNRIYRKVWNKSLGLWTVASELASGDSTGTVAASAPTDRRHGLTLSAAIAFALGGGAVLGATPAQAQSVEVGGNQNCIVLGGSILDSCAVDGSANASGANAVAVG